MGNPLVGCLCQSLTERCHCHMPSHQRLDNLANYGRDFQRMRPCVTQKVLQNNSLQ